MDIFTEDIPVNEAVDDELLLIEAARQNPEAFDALYCRYLTPVYRYLYSRVQNKADAEDLAGQVFMEALEGLARYRDRGSFAAWVFTIARRRAIDHHRRHRLVFSLDETREHADGHDPLAQLMENERLQLLAQHLQTLHDDERELLRLRFAAELTFPEMGTVLKRRPEAVKMALHRLLHRLKELMNPTS